MTRVLILFFIVLTITCSFAYKGTKSSSDPAAVINFRSTSISFGHVTAGKKISKEFKFKNTGTDSLRINTVQASDGGTMAYWPKKPIPPGGRDVIKVELGFTESRSGYQDKEFTVISNAQNNPVVLHLNGYIKKKD